ncbi:MotA/TolQ/ExbB proton channel family protein [Acinetobacter sp. NigerLNRRAM0016]
MNKMMNPVKKIATASLIAASTLLPIHSAFAEDAAPATTTAVTSSDSSNAPQPPAKAEAAPAYNPYGLEAMWKEGDMVAKTTLFILVMMSIGTWYIMITKLLQQSKIKGQGRRADAEFWDASTLESATDSLEKDSVFRFIAEKGIHSTKNHEGSLLERIDFNTWVTISIQRAIDKIQSHLSGGLAFLATVGSTAPFVGLFGTVWGIYHALTAIGMSGQASIDKVAGPVGEALIMTAIGLAVAVPAVLGYNWLSRRNKAVMENVRTFGSDLHTVLLSGEISSNPNHKKVVNK